MPNLKNAAFVLSFLIAVGCASTDPDPPKTEVDGMVVSEGDDDMEREFSDEEVAQFAKTYVEVTAIQQQYEVQMQEADAGEREALVDESNQRSEEVIIDNGMTPQEYNAIAVRLPTDDALRQRVRQAIQERDDERVQETERQLETQ